MQVCWGGISRLLDRSLWAHQLRLPLIADGQDGGQSYPFESLLSTFIWRLKCKTCWSCAVAREWYVATMMMKIGRYEFPLPAFFLLTGARAGPQLLQFVQNNLHYVHFAMVHRALHTAKHIVHINVKWEEKSLVFSNLCIVLKVQCKSCAAWPENL